MSFIKFVFVFSEHAVSSKYTKTKKEEENADAAIKTFEIEDEIIASKRKMTTLGNLLKFLLMFDGFMRTLYSTIVAVGVIQAKKIYQYLQFAHHFIIIIGSYYAVYCILSFYFPNVDENKENEIFSIHLFNHFKLKISQCC